MHLLRDNCAGKGIAALILAGIVLCGGLFPKESFPDGLSDSGPALLVRQKIAGWTDLRKTYVRGVRINSADLVRTFYQERDCHPAWTRDGQLLHAGALISALKEAESDGLLPDDYHMGLLESMVERTVQYSAPADIADLDILMTDAFLTLGRDLSGRASSGATVETELFAERSNSDLPSLLEQALREKGIRETLAGLRPGHASYSRLRQALAVYRELAAKGGWQRISGGPAMKRGTTSFRVAQLRKRLEASGDLAAGYPALSNLFDARLERSVVSFQGRHGLKEDGVVGSATLSALNVPLAQRIRQIELNMERLRRVLGNMEHRAVVVNIADFKLYVVEDGRAILSMKVVVGQPYRQTPVFRAEMTYMVINPSWNIPDSIARDEILPKIKRNSHYLSEENIKVLSRWGAEEMDPGTIDWRRISPENLTYKFRQEPGPRNPLGRVKFMLPNQFEVYLHDTPSRRLFSKEVRAFSHGCTRIEKPLELAEYVLRGSPRWTRDALLSSIQKGMEQKVVLPRPIEVYFLYLTSWVDSRGAVQFRDDIYGRDAVLDRSLVEKRSD